MSDLEWRDNLVPISLQFDDPYYSKDDGRAETSHVFIDGNRLKDRWPKMSTCTIAELGFGTGLNFAETILQWRQARAAGSHLHFISFEQFPITSEEMVKALSVWPELLNISDSLAKSWNSDYSPIVIELDEFTRLTLHLGDANSLLPSARLEADAWYLDGFSPAKNPELWNEYLLQQVADHTVAGGTFATYSAAGHVKRSLEKAGFKVEKAKGFGRKRDMLVGQIGSDIHVAK